MSTRVFQAQARVITPQGPGTVVYARNAPPDYTEVAAYVVKLDSRKDHPTYTGTVYTPDQLKEEGK